MKRILIVVDMQKGFARYPQTISLEKKIEELLDKRIFDKVVATKFFNDTNSIYEKLFNWNRLKTSDEQSLPEGISKHVDHIVDKTIYNCVNADFIQKLCQLNDGQYPEKVFVIGADTDCCVLTIATSLFEYNIRPIVLTRYCDSNGGPLAHEAGIICLKRLIGEEQLFNDELNKSSILDQI